MTNRAADACCGDGREMLTRWSEMWAIFQNRSRNTAVHNTEVRNTAVQRTAVQTSTIRQGRVVDTSSSGSASAWLLVFGTSNSTKVSPWLCVTLGLLTLGCSSTTEKSADLRSPPAPQLAWTHPKRSAEPRSEKATRARDLVIHEHRFVSRSAELNLEGEDQLQRLAGTLRESPHKLVIESSGASPALRVVSQQTPEESGKLDRQRREYVIQQLLSLGIADAESRVVLESKDSISKTSVPVSTIPASTSSR